MWACLRGIEDDGSKKFFRKNLLCFCGWRFFEGVKIYTVNLREYGEQNICIAVFP